MDVDTILWFLLRLVIFVLVAGPAALMGNAIAETWRPWWQNVVYGFLLAVGIQFLGYALLMYLLEAVFISGISLLAYRITKARKMVTQYPWLYERAGLMAWRAKNEG